jgi:Leucine-rich repeat (LRR) protein
LENFNINTDSGPRLAGWECRSIAYVATQPTILLPTSNPCYTWANVYCSAEKSLNTGRSTQHIREIFLGNLSLYGTLPTEIGDFEALEALHMDSNALYGTIPSAIGKLTSLRLFHMDTNSLTGSLPSSIGNMISLRSLSAHSNKLQSALPETLGNLINLEYIYLNNNKFTSSIPIDVSKLASLEYVYLQYNKFNGVLPFTTSKNVNLKFLDATQNYFFCYMGDLTNLVEYNQYQSDFLINSANADAPTDISSSILRIDESAIEC